MSIKFSISFTFEGVISIISSAGVNFSIDLSWMFLGQDHKPVQETKYLLLYANIFYQGKHYLDGWHVVKLNLFCFSSGQIYFTLNSLNSRVVIAYNPIYEKNINYLCEAYFLLPSKVLPNEEDRKFFERW